MIIHILLYNLIAVLILLIIIKKNPRYLLQDYPDEIIKDAPKQTSGEVSSGRLFSLPFMAVLFFYPLVIELYGGLKYPFDFLSVLSRYYLYMFSFNLTDLIIIDWLLFCTISPSFMIIPGTNGHKGYQNYKFHALAFLRGTIITAVMSLLLATITGLIALSTAV